MAGLGQAWGGGGKGGRRHGWVWSGLVRSGKVGYGKARQAWGGAWYGVARLGKVGQAGEAGQGEARLGRQGWVWCGEVGWAVGEN